MRRGARSPDGLARAVARPVGDRAPLPECEWESTGVHGEADVQRYDALLNEGTDSLIEHVEQLAHDNMAAEIERFVAALRDDHITPFDF
jgi:hypothetical protein